MCLCEADLHADALRSLRALVRTLHVQTIFYPFYNITQSISQAVQQCAFIM